MFTSRSRSFVDLAQTWRERRVSWQRFGPRVIIRDVAVNLNPNGLWDGTCGSEHNPGGQFVKANGRPCGARVIAGHTRCYIHGAASIGSKLKAEQTMALLRMPAIEALFRLLEKLEEPTCPTCGYPVHDGEDQKLLLATAKAVLDRTGLHPKVAVEHVRQSDGDLDLALLNEHQRGRLVAALTAIKEVKEEVRLQHPEPSQVM